ncbi:hypothetical protein [Niameybacter massiliensis]|uniref:hypothetical protein n=1 Tax=Niameybacter massiliensis TaxID=1658108 RepID=UPI0006B58E3B|nr:hypothetical protein [Niameybacter massiliensis]
MLITEKILYAIADGIIDLYLSLKFTSNEAKEQRILKEMQNYPSVDEYKKHKKKEYIQRASYYTKLDEKTVQRIIEEQDTRNS